MKNLSTLVIFLFLSSFVFATDGSKDLKKDFVVGDPGISSINALAFGPEDILFIGDSKAAQIVALDLSGHSATDNSKINIKDVDGVIAKQLGTTKDQIQITDMVVNPSNNNIYLSVMHSSGKALLYMVREEGLVPLVLDNAHYTKASLTDAIDEDAKDRRGRDLRKWAISDLHYSDGKVMVSGLSNQEFASTFRSIDFPYNQQQHYSSLEIYHAAHGQYETHAPIKAFTTAQVNGSEHMIASYTCTPLVVFPLSQMASGEHTKGRTIAELGNWNTPLDIIEMEKDGNRYILMANSARALMKIKMADIESFGEALTSRVEERSGTAGVDFINLPFVNVQQLAKLNDTQFLMLQRESSGDLVLKTQNNRWL